MTIRTSKKTVTFKRPFDLDGYNEMQPAGDYIVETDEELLEGISFPVYRRILTLLHLHPTGGIRRIWTIDPKELEAALTRDQTSSETPIVQDASEGKQEAMRDNAGA